MNVIPMTIAGHERLKTELHQLKNIERPAVIEAIRQGRAHGDLKENAEYHAAKERQSYIEGRIQLLESMLVHARIIDVTKLSCDGRVIFGATVKLYNLNTEEEKTYTIVSEYEAEIKEGKISVTSPLARAMVSKCEGDAFSFNAPTGIVEYEILKVSYI